VKLITVSGGGIKSHQTDKIAPKRLQSTTGAVDHGSITGDHG